MIDDARKKRKIPHNKVSNSSIKSKELYEQQRIDTYYIIMTTAASGNYYYKPTLDVKVGYPSMIDTDTGKD